MTEKVKIQTALEKLNISSKGTNFHCPNKDAHANGDRNPSAGFYDGDLKWKCRACGTGGDAFDLVRTARGCTFAEAKAFLGQPAATAATPPTRHKAAPEPWPATTPGTEADWHALAKLRGMDWRILRIASETGTLVFGEHRSRRFWAITDRTAQSMEGRRLDGELWANGKKAFAFPGSCKNWPVGLRTGTVADKCRRLVLTEGPPDFLAALHLLFKAGRPDILPICALGASVRFSPEALDAIAKRPVAIWAQPDEVGRNAAARWAGELAAAGSRVTPLVPYPQGDVDDWHRTGPSRAEILDCLPYSKGGAA